MIFIYIYGLFNIIVGVISLKKIPLKNIFIIEVSGLLLIVSGALDNILLLVIGLVINQLVMISNGIYIHGKVNKGHHVVRLFINSFILLMYIYYSK